MLKNIVDKKDLKSEEVEKEFTILEEDPGIKGAVPVVFSAVYFDRTALKKAMAPIMSKEKPSDADEERWRNSVVVHCMRNWSGVNFVNLCRLSDWCFMHRDAVWSQLEAQGLESKESEIPFDLEGGQWLANKLNPEIFSDFVNKITKQEDFVMAADINKKK